VIENYTIQSGTHEFLLTFHSNQWPISHRFRDKRRFSSKIANFSHPVYLTPRWSGSPWNWVSAQGSEETRMMWLPDGRKSFKIGLAVLIQYRRVTASQPRCRSKYALCISALRSKKRSERCKHCALAVIRWSKKKLRPVADPLPGGAGRPKFNQLEMVTIWWKSMHAIPSYKQFRVIVGTDPQTTPARRLQTGPIKIHCAAKLSAKCNQLKVLTV